MRLQELATVRVSLGAASEAQRSLAAEERAEALKLAAEQWRTREELVAHELADARREVAEERAEASERAEAWRAREELVARELADARREAADARAESASASERAEQAVLACASARCEAAAAERGERAVAFDAFREQLWGEKDGALAAAVADQRACSKTVSHLEFRLGYARTIERELFNVLRRPHSICFATRSIGANYRRDTVWKRDL